MKDMNDEERLNALFANSAGRRLLSDYCKVELSIENFTAYDFILKYEEAGLPFEMAQEFQTRFVQRNANKDPYLGGGNKAFQQAMAKSDPGKILVDDMKRAILVNLLDTFPRFKTTPAYNNWLNSAYTAGPAI